MPAFLSAISVMNRPMPTATAFLIETGIALKIASRTGVTDSARKIRPSTNTASSANAQL